MYKHCQVCGDILSESKLRRHAKFCSDTCSKIFTRNHYMSMGMDQQKIELTKATVGALHEIYVCVDLMNRGLNVFRALSPSCPCDLIAMENNNTYRVEVTTGYTHLDGGFTIPKRPDHYKFDWLAIVFHSGEIHYIKDGVEFDIDTLYPNHYKNASQPV